MFQEFPNVKECGSISKATSSLTFKFGDGCEANLDSLAFVVNPFVDKTIIGGYA